MWNLPPRLWGDSKGPSLLNISILLVRSSSEKREPTRHTHADTTEHTEYATDDDIEDLNDARQGG